MFCDQPHTYCWGREGGGGREGWRQWNNLIRRQHVEQCRSEGRIGTLNLERDCEIVRPRPTFPSRVVMQGRGDGGRERERKREMRRSKGEIGSRSKWEKESECRGMRGHRKESLNESEMQGVV